MNLPKAVTDVAKYSQAILAQLPPETVPEFAGMLGDLFNGNTAGAQRRMKFVAEGLGAKQAIRAGYRAKR